MTITIHQGQKAESEAWTWQANMAWEGETRKMQTFNRRLVVQLNLFPSLSLMYPGTGGSKSHERLWNSWGTEENMVWMPHTYATLSHPGTVSTNFTSLAADRCRTVPNDTTNWDHPTVPHKIKPKSHIHHNLLSYKKEKNPTGYIVNFLDRTMIHLF